MNYRDQASERSIRARLARLQKLHGIEPVISAKVGDIRRRVERLERRLKGQDGSTHE